MNQKGFTMIEILVAVTILGILSVMTIAGYSRYVYWAKIEGYDVMANSVKQAAENYIMDHPGDATEAKESPNYYLVNQAPPITFQELIDQGYLKNTADPVDKSSNCLGSVRIGYIPGGSSKVLDQYIYEINLCCSNQKKQYYYSYALNKKDPRKDIIDEAWVDNGEGNSSVNISVVCDGLTGA